MEPSSKPALSLQILVVDDEANIRRTLSLCLEQEGHKVVAVSNARDALNEAENRVFDLAFVDIRLGMSNGLDLLPQFQTLCPWMKIVVITAYASVETAVEAMRRGALDYLPKPFTPEQVALMAQRVAGYRVMEKRVESLQTLFDQHQNSLVFETCSPAMQRVLDMAKQVAASESTVLLRGESGTGKSVLARAIHQWSPRTNGAFCVVSCPSLNPDLLESELFGHVKGAFTGAHRDQPGRIVASEGGTLFLDEIGDLPLHLQPKLLRFLQDREYERVGDNRTRQADVRIIAATNTDLETAVKDGRFREDLFYRLSVFPLELPPLRERREDIEAIATAMLAAFGRQNHRNFLGFTPDTLTCMVGYDWPGNLRELQNTIERAAILCPGEMILPEHLSLASAPKSLSELAPLSLSALEEQHIRKVLIASKSLQEAADVLQIDLSTLWRKRKQYGI